MTIKTVSLTRFAVALLLAGAVVLFVALYPGPIGATAAYGPGASCGLLRGTYGFTGFGTIFPGNALGFPPGTVSTNGTVTIGRDGQTTVVEAEVIDGVLVSPSSTYQGTITVNPDCTFTVAMPPLPGPAFVGVAVDNGKQVRAMTTIPGVQINFVSTIKVHPERSY